MWLVSLFHGQEESCSLADSGTVVCGLMSIRGTVYTRETMRRAGLNFKADVPSRDFTTSTGEGHAFANVEAIARGSGLSLHKVNLVLLHPGCHIVTIACQGA